MDMISYGIASKAAKAANETKSTLGDGVEGSHPHVQSRLDTLETAIQGVVAQADKLIINDAINIAKAHAKLNAVAKTKKYRMHNMVFDDLLDLSGIDTQKSSGYTHDAVEGALVAEANCVIETKEEVTDAAPSKVILTVEEEAPSGYLDITPRMIRNNSPSPYVASSSIEYNPSYYAFDGDAETLWRSESLSHSNASYGWLQLDMGEGNTKAINKYTLTVPSNFSSYSTPREWKLLASNTGNFNGEEVVLDEQTIDSAFREKEFSFINENEYRYYRFAFYKARSNNQPVYLDGIRLFESAKSEESGVYVTSRDNGVTWESITPDTLFYFTDSISPLDNQLRLKAELPSGTKLLNYSLTWA